jgi:pimeloyl-ACP methyl ester carboxylesterase
MADVISQDGTKIAFSRVGRGEPVILVDGALCYRASGPSRPLAEKLAERFTVITYDRRGRGESGDRAPYALEREVEDVEALIAEVGGSAYLYGVSSGGALALEAANRLAGVKKLAVYEVPFVVDATRAPYPPDYGPHLQQLIAADRRGEAVKYFLTQAVGLPGFLIALMRPLPVWSKSKAVAHTLPYDAAALGPETVAGKPLPTDRWSTIAAPTLVAGGGKSPEWMRNSVTALARVLGAEQRTLEKQNHMVKPAVLAPVLADFFAGAGGGTPSHRVERGAPSD